MKTDTEILFHSLADDGQAITAARSYLKAKYRNDYTANEVARWILTMGALRKKIIEQRKKFDQNP